MHVSFWEKDSFYNDIDYAIVGSGFVGLSTALEIRANKPDAKIVVLEKGFLPSGASTKNAGFACYGSPSEILSDLKIMSEEEVFAMVEKRWKGLLNLRSLLGDEALDYKGWGSCELFTPDDQEVYQETIEQLDFLNAFLKPIFDQDVYESRDDLIGEFGFEKVDHIIRNKFEGQIDTGKAMQALLAKVKEADITIINGVNVQKIDQAENGVTVTLNDFAIEAKCGIIAVNGFAKDLLPELDVEPARAQVLITTPIEGLKLKGTFHYEQGYYYFRNIGNRVLFGGGRNLAYEEENTAELGVTEIIQNKLEALLDHVILPYKQDYEVEMRWAGIMGVGQKKTTIVRKLDRNLICAVRMGGMGVAIGSLIGKEAAQLAVGDCQAR